MKIWVCDGVAKEAVELLKSNGYDVVEGEPTKEDLLAHLKEYDGIIVRSRTKLPAEVLETAPNLRVIGRAGIGVDNIDVKKATEMGIPVVNAPTGSTVSVAELTMGMMLSLARHIPRADRTMKEGKWEKKRLKGVELYEKTLGLIGVGRIAREVAKRARAFGMTVIGYDPYVPENVAREAGVELVSLEKVLTDSDFVSIHTALTPETRGLIGEEELKKMKNTAYLINCARGGIADENALYRALKEGWIKGAALDVYEKEPPEGSPLLGLDNVILTPHIGASTVEGQRRAGVIVAEQVIKVLKGEKPDFLVNREMADRWE